MNAQRMTVTGVVAMVLTLAGCTTLDSILVSTDSSSGTGAATSAGNVVAASSIAIGNNETVELEAVTYQGTLVIDSNNAWIYGAGAGRTVIDGDVTIEGNRNELRGVTVTGTIRIRGNINSIIQSDLDNATVIDTGNNNTY